MNILKSIFCLSITLCFYVAIQAQDWEQVGDTPFYKHHSNGFGYNGKAYVIEGHSNHLWEYSPDTDSWVQLADFPGAARRIAIGDEWNGKYYYGFGRDLANGNALTDLWEFDPADTSFTELPSCPCIGRTHPALIAYNDKVFMGTGSTDNGDIDDWWEYDMITQEWSQKPNMPGGPRHHPFFFESGDYVYAGGGHLFNWLQYDPANETWTPIDNAPGGRVAGSQLSYNGKGLLVGGDDYQHNHVPDFESFMMYDPIIGEWIYLPELPNGSRWACSSFIIDHTLYFFGGISNFVQNDVSMWKFDLSVLDCLPPGSLDVTSVSDDSAVLFWVAPQDAISDTLKWREVGSTDWNVIPDPNPFFQLTNLESCREYEFQIVSMCLSASSNSQSFSFLTKGCGACIDFEFCPVYEDLAGNEVYIDRVEVNSYTNISGSNSGYESFVLPDSEIIFAGETFSLTIEMSPNTLGPEIEVWIDFNGNGIFENDEKVLTEEDPELITTRDIFVPIFAEPGLSKMRIICAKTFGISSPCDNANTVIFGGEAEDYCLHIESPTNTDNIFQDGQNSISVYPNPVKDVINLKSNLPLDKNYNARIVNTIGETLMQLDDFYLDEAIDLSGISSGLYFLIIEDEVSSYSIKVVKED